MAQENCRPLIDLTTSLPERTRPWLTPLVRGAEALLGVNALHRVYARAMTAPGETFFDRGLSALDRGYAVEAEEETRIPREGPLMVIANHPYGGLDGLILGSLLTRTRPDFKFLANELLRRIPELDRYVFPVEVFGTAAGARRNVTGLRASLQWLRQGGALGTFPAGVVSHFQWRRGRVADPLWHAHLASLIRRTGATVLPVWIEGRNSLPFQILGMVHPLMRTGLLVREMLKPRAEPVIVRVGHAIPARRLEGFASDRQMTEFLRLRTEVLARKTKRDGGTKSQEAGRLKHFPGWRPAERAMEPIPPAAQAEDLAAEIERLPEDTLMVSHGPYRVYVATAGQIPQVLLELGRLREETFREVHEGTGRARAIEPCDRYYRHLFMWHEEDQQIVGAYRLGLTDEILSRHGPKGLYTTKLFHIGPQFHERLGPSIELGRSFIRARYQRQHHSLAMIWRGIGAFLVRHPHYRHLFGPVSISRDYHSLSRQLMVQFLIKRNLHQDLARWVRPRHPHRIKPFGPVDEEAVGEAPRDLEDVSALVSEIEHDAKGIPVLLRHYLKLNATLTAFNVDPDFSDVVDGLVVVEVAKTDRKILKRFMSEGGVKSYLAYQQKLVSSMNAASF